MLITFYELTKFVISPRFYNNLTLYYASENNTFLF